MAFTKNKGLQHNFGCQTCIYGERVKKKCLECNLCVTLVITIRWTFLQEKGTRGS